LTPKMKPKNPRNSASDKVSRMITIMEAKSRNLKHVPSKLLSRPVNFYDSSTKL